MITAEEARAELARRGKGMQSEQTQLSVPTNNQSNGIVNPEEAQAELNRREQANAQQMQQQTAQQQQMTNPSNWVLRGAGDVARGMAEGGRQLHNLPYNVTHWFNPAGAERIATKGNWAGRNLFAPDLNSVYNFGVNNPNGVDKFIQAAAPAVGLALAGGGGWGGMIGSSALTGALESAEDPIRGAIIGGTVGAGFKGAGTLGSMLKNTRPAKYGKELAKRGTAEYLEETARPSSNLYNEVRAKTAGKSILQNSPIENLSGPSREAQQLYRESDYRKLGQAFKRTEGFEEAKDLRGQIASEINDLSLTKKMKGSLTPAEKARKDVLISEAKRYKSYMNGFLEQNPEIKTIYEKANLLHRRNVIPSRHGAKIINDFIDAEGNIIDKRGLINALSKASSRNAITKRPIAKETLNLNKTYEGNLNNKETLMKYLKYLTLGSVPALGLGMSNYHTLRHLWEANRT